MELARPLTLPTLLSLLGSQVKDHLGPKFPSISQIHQYKLSNPESLTFLGQNVPASALQNTPAAVVISDVYPPSEERIEYTAWIIVNHLYQAMNVLLLHIEEYLPQYSFSIEGAEVHPSAVVYGRVERGARIGPFCFVGKNSRIGENCVLEPRVTILERCTIGKNCTLQPGVVVGPAGFGFYPQENKLQPIHHRAGVEIGENCQIGANSVVAAGVWDPTSIGPHSCLDSFVQIAHNVLLGEGAALASQAGIAGSTVVGKHLRMGGNSSIAGHLVIGDHVSVAALSGVTKNISTGMEVAGFPAQPLKVWKKQQIALKNAQGRYTK